MFDNKPRAAATRRSLAAVSDRRAGERTRPFGQVPRLARDEARVRAQQFGACVRRRRVVVRLGEPCDGSRAARAASVRVALLGRAHSPRQQNAAAAKNTPTSATAAAISISHRHDGDDVHNRRPVHRGQNTATSARLLRRATHPAAAAAAKRRIARTRSERGEDASRARHGGQRARGERVPPRSPRGYVARAGDAAAAGQLRDRADLHAPHRGLHRCTAATVTVVVVSLAIAGVARTRRRRRRR